MKIIFLDTNIYLHYQPFEQINWLEVVKAEAVTIFVPPIIIRELNKHKDTHSALKIKKRAGAALKRLAEIFDLGSSVQLKNGVGIKQEDRDPIINFDEYQLDRTVQDDNLVASALVCKKENPDSDVIIVTADTGLNLLGKARRLDIQTIRIPDTFKLPDEPDPEQEQIKKLQREVNELKQKSPDLSLIFENDDSHMMFQLSPVPIISEHELEEQLQKIQIDYPKEENKQPDKSKKPSNQNDVSIILNAALAEMDVISSDEIIRYNKELDEFYKHYADYFKRQFQLQCLMSRTIKLGISVVNKGKAPADDVDIFMHFPGGFKLFTEDNYPKFPKPPNPPELPKSQLQNLRDGPRLSYESYHPLEHKGSVPDVLPSNVSAVNIKYTHGYDVDFNIQRLKHSLKEPADTIYIAFDSVETIRSFQIDYQILVSTPPEDFSGSLHVIVEII